MSFRYNYEANTPASGEPYHLTPSWWEEQTYKESWHEMQFLALMGPEGSGQCIVYRDSMLGKGGSTTHVNMRAKPAENSQPVKGNAQLINYGTLSSSLTEDMTWRRMEIYAGRERFSWKAIGLEDVRMVMHLEPILQSIDFVGELHRQRAEEQVLQTLFYGLSASVTALKGKGGADDITAPDDNVGYMRKVPPSFKWTAATNDGNDILGLPHPNTYFIDSTDTNNLIYSTPAADIEFDDICNSMNALTGTTGKISMDKIRIAQRFAMLHKIRKVATPWGLRWLWFIPTGLGPDIRAILEDYHENAGPRSYTENLIWGSVIGPAAGFLFIESEYMKDLYTYITRDHDTNSKHAYDHNDGGTGRMDINDISSSSTNVYPTFIVGADALAFSMTESMSHYTKEPDPGNSFFRIGARTYGFRRADWFNDDGTDYCGGGAASLDIEARLNQTPKVYNYSSMLVIARGTAASLL